MGLSVPNKGGKGWVDMYKNHKRIKAESHLLTDTLFWKTSDENLSGKVFKYPTQTLEVQMLVKEIHQKLFHSLFLLKRDGLAFC